MPKGETSSGLLLLLIPPGNEEVDGRQVDDEGGTDTEVYVPKSECIEEPTLIGRVGTQ